MQKMLQKFIHNFFGFYRYFVTQVTSYTLFENTNSGLSSAGSHIEVHLKVWEVVIEKRFMSLLEISIFRLEITTARWWSDDKWKTTFCSWALELSFDDQVMEIGNKEADKSHFEKSTSRVLFNLLLPSRRCSELPFIIVSKRPERVGGVADYIATD